MRRFIKFSLVCLVAGSASACKMADLVVPTETLPYAGVRFINAVPDSSGAFGLDMRFVDLLESNAHFRILFRNAPAAAAPFVSTAIQYKGARAGSRQFRIFLDDTLQSIASTVVKDTTVSLVALHNYTAMLWGNGRSAGVDKMRLNFWEETVADPATQVALRIINATNTAVDGRAFLSGGTVPATATWANVAPYTASAYVLFAPGVYTYNVQPVGGGAVIATNANTMPGAVASCSGLACKTGEKEDIEAQPGSNVAGSAVTGILFPRSTAGARTPQATAFTTPTITFMWDRRPPRACSPIC